MYKKQKSVNEVLAHCDKWDAMYKRLGAHGVAKIMIKTKSWRDYISKWPFDYIEQWSTVKQLDGLADFLADDHISIEDEMDAKLDYERFVASLSERQRKVWDGIVSGMNSREIEASHNFGSNNTVRWYKHKVKNKYLKMKFDTVNEYICKDCAWQWRSKESFVCERCNAKDILRTRKNIPNIPEDI
jgi:hypothetical protein